MDIQTVPFSAQERASGEPTEATRTLAAEAFRRDGAIVMQDCFAPELIARMRAAYDARYGVFDESQVPEGAWHVGLQRWSFLLDLAPPLVPLCAWAEAPYLPILKDLLGKTCTLANFTALVSFPGALLQRAHRDHPYLFDEDRELAAQLPPYALTLAIPLVDLTPDTGTTAMWLGTHRQPRFGEDPNAPDPVMPYMKAGSAYMYDIRLMHLGTGNSTDQPRPILFFVFSRGWFTDRQNFGAADQIRIAQADYEALPDEARRMLGGVRPYPSPAGAAR